MSECCKEEVRCKTNFYRTRRCKRRAWKDGYCTQHHPENVKKRDEEKAHQERQRFLYSWEGRFRAVRSEKIRLYDLLAEAKCGMDGASFYGADLRERIECALKEVVR